MSFFAVLGGCRNGIFTERWRQITLLKKIDQLVGGWKKTPRFLFDVKLKLGQLECMRYLVSDFEER